jgi:hypothetical protein
MRRPSSRVEYELILSSNGSGLTPDCRHRCLSKPGEPHFVPIDARMVKTWSADGRKTVLTPADPLRHWAG